MSKQAPHGPTSDADLLEWLRAEHAQPFEGWDFSYMNERHVEPAKHKDLHRLIGAVWAESHSVLDVETGGGERMAEWIAAFGNMKLMAAVEAYPPNVPVARRVLEPLGVKVVRAAAASIPIPRCQLRPDHQPPVTWPRRRFSDSSGEGDVWSLNRWDRTPTRRSRRWFGRAAAGDRWDLGVARAQAEAVGLTVEDAEEAFHASWFLDAGAMAYYLKAVPWDVPDFEIERYADRLLALHHHIQSEGRFGTTIHQFLLVARR